MVDLLTGDMYTAYRNEKFRLVLKSKKFFYNATIFSYHDRGAELHSPVSLVGKELFPFN